MTNSPFLEVLKNRDFLKIWISQILSQVTINLINFVIVLRIFESTHSTVAVSLVWIFYAMPALLLGPFSGTIVDLADKRKVLIVTTLLEALIVLLYLFVQTKVWPIYSIIFLYSLVNQLYIPTEASVLTSVVPKNLLSIANTIFLFTIYTTLLIGFGTAGFLIRITGRNSLFAAASFFLIIASLSVYRLSKKTKSLNGKINGINDFWEKAQEGYSFVRRRRDVLFPLGILVLANVVLSTLAVLAPIFATEVLGIELLDVGPVVILPIGVGAVLGSGIIVSLLKKFRKKRIITFALFVMITTLFILSLILPTVSFGKIFFAMLTTFLLGFAWVSLFIPAQTSIQEKTPPEFRGRVFGILGFLFTLASVLPILIVATIADTIGVVPVIFMIMVCLSVVTICVLKESVIGVNYAETKH